MTRQEQIIWAAGFFDGEGYIGICKKKVKETVSHCLKLQVTNVVPTPLQDLKDLFGGSIYKKNRCKSHHRDAFTWQAEHIIATNAIIELLPFLRVKKDEALLGLEFQSRKKSYGTKVSMEELEQREKYYVKMKELKHREY